MQDKALQSEKMQDNPAKSRTVGNSAVIRMNESDKYFVYASHIVHQVTWACTYYP